MNLHLCPVCTHPKATEINRLLYEKTPYSEIGMVFFLSEDAIGRHKLNHMRRVLKE
jgi:hypothetical protein